MRSWASSTVTGAMVRVMSAEPVGGGWLGLDEVGLGGLGLGAAGELGLGTPGSMTIWAEDARACPANAKGPSLRRSRRFTLGWVLMGWTGGGEFPRRWSSSSHGARAKANAGALHCALRASVEMTAILGETTFVGG